MTSTQPPPYIPIRTVYDETHRGKFYMEPAIYSMGDRANLLGYLEHHSRESDGSFGICVASGDGVMISQALLESIPAPYRPVLDTDNGKQSLKTLFGDGVTSIGSTFFPFILTDAQTGERMRLVLYALVVPKLPMGMFIAQSAEFWKGEVWQSDGVTFTFDFGQNGLHKFEGICWWRA